MRWNRRHVHTVNVTDLLLTLLMHANGSVDIRAACEFNAREVAEMLRVLSRKMEDQADREAQPVLPVNWSPMDKLRST